MLAVVDEYSRESLAIEMDRRPTSRDELRNGEIFYTRQETQVLIETCRIRNHRVRPHSSLGYLPPAPQALLGSPTVEASWLGELSQRWGRSG